MKRQRNVIGLDVGTSAVKATFLGEDGSENTVVSKAYAVQTPAPGFAEQNPDDWWEATCEVLDRIGIENDLAPAQTVIGLTGQMHTSVLRDDEGGLIRPAILWSDQRAAEECGELIEAVPNWGDVAGLDPISAFTSSHLAWVRKNEPDSFARIASVAVTKDDIRRRLAGLAVTDESDASAMNLQDTFTGDWSDPLLDAVGIDRGQLPSIRPSEWSTGVVTNEELPSSVQGAIVVGGAGDQFAQAIALDLTEPGDVGIAIGTSGAAFSVLDKPRRGAFRHAVPERWLALDSSHASGLAMSWWSAISGIDIPAFGQGMGQSLHNNPVFLPDLQGHRGGGGAPGSLIGLRAEHTSADIAAAVVEGVAVELGRLVISVTDGQPSHSPVRVGGRAAAVPALRVVLATMLDRPVHWYNRGSSFGAAVIAARHDDWLDPSRLAKSSAPIETLPDPSIRSQILDRIERSTDLASLLS